MLISPLTGPAGVAILIILSALVFNAQRRIEIANVIFHITVNNL